MSVFKSTYSRVLRAHPSDNADIAYPNAIASGVSTSTIGTNIIVDVNGDFVNKGVKTGDVIHNDTLSTAATVVTVSSDGQTLVLNADIFLALGQSYIVYAMSSQSSQGNPGCVLYIGGAGNVSVVTIGGEQIGFTGLAAGTILPVQVRRLRATGTTATNVNALW